MLYKNIDWKDSVNDGEKVRIPSDWNTFSLDTICEKITDGTHASFKDCKENNSQLLLSAKNVKNNELILSDNERYISFGDYKEIIKKGLPIYGDILFTIVGTIGYSMVWESNKPEAFQRSVSFIRTKESVNNKFVYFFLQSNYIKYEIKKKTKTAVQSGIYLSDLKSLSINLPPIKEQIKIANILSEQQNLVKKLKDKERLLHKNLIGYQQLFLSGKTRIKLSKEKEQELLLKGVISLVEEKTEKEQISVLNINEGKFEEFISLVDLTKDIVLNQNDEGNWKTEEVNELQKQLPKDWNVEQLYKKVNFIKGKSIPENQLNYNGEGLKYLKTTEFWLDSSSKRDTVHYTGKVEEKYMKKKDEYVLGMDGFNSKIGEGTLGLISNEDEGIVSTHFFKLEKNEIYYLVVNVLKSNYVQNFIVRLGEGTTVKMAGKYLKNLQGIFPKSTVEQKLLSMIFEKEEKLVDSLKEKIKLEEKVFKYLQQELLSGRIRITVEE